MTEHLEHAIALATANVDAGGGPFGALVVLSDGRVFEGVNRVTLDLDPTAHAEVVAIRTACAALGRFELSDAVLYTSCEPCPLCASAALWARIPRVVYAADRHDAAEAGFDDAAFYEYFEGGARQVLSVTRGASERSTAPFERWSAAEARTEY